MNALRVNAPSSNNYLLRHVFRTDDTLTTLMSIICTLFYTPIANFIGLQNPQILP